MAKKTKSKSTNKSKPKKTASTEATITKSQENNIINRYIILGVILVAVLATLYFVRNKLIAAKVNGQPINRLDIISKLENQYGQPTLDQMIYEVLIMQQAQEENIEITEEELDKEIEELKNEFEAMGQNFETLLEQQNMTVDDLKKQLKVKLILDKLVTDQIQVTDEEIDQYIESNQDFFQEGTDTESEEFRNQTREQIKAQKGDLEINNLLEKLKSEADIQYNVFYAPEEIEQEEMQTPEAQEENTQESTEAADQETE